MEDDAAIFPALTHTFISTSAEHFDIATRLRERFDGAWRTPINVEFTSTERAFAPHAFVFGHSLFALSLGLVVFVRDKLRYDKPGSCCVCATSFVVTNLRGREVS